METSLKEWVQKLHSNAPNAGACSVIVQTNNGKYPSRALGLGTLKEQQTHYKKVYNGEREVVSPHLQVRFEY